jgi:alkylation response protein AidB-like acyl-CoA dehydrogenase
MDLELSEEQEHLGEGLRSLLEGSGGERRMRRVAYEGDGSDPELWGQLVGNGWTTALLPESAGGLGLGFEEALVIAIECGRHVLHLPLCETLLATRVALQAGPAGGDLLEAVAAGARLTLAVGGDIPGQNDADDGIARLDGEGRLQGRVRSVAFGPLANRCLVEAKRPDGSTALVDLACDAAGAHWTERGAMDLSVRRFDLDLSGAPTSDLFEGDARGQAERLADEWRVLMAAQTEGACRRMLELTADYVKRREQFGRPVGSNQAVKVRLAEMAAAVERLRAALYLAALAVQNESDERPLVVAMAKAQAAEPGAFVATQAIHAHGAIGYTWEQDVHLFAKRVKTNELLLGAGAEMMGRIADLVIDGGA